MTLSSTDDPPDLALAGVSVQYGSVRALDSVSVTLNEGVTALLGPNGAGKTTLFRVAAGVLPPASGSVRIAGRDPTTDPDVKSEIGYLAHGAALDGRRSVRANLDFWAAVYGVPAPDRPRRIDAVAERFDFVDLLDRDGDALSRGQRQRVGLARALVHDPSILFLDEPTSGLDPTAAASLRTELDAVAAETTLLYATHNLHEAATLADDIAFIREGRLVDHDSVETLLARSTLSEAPRVAVTAGPDAEQVLEALGYDPTRDGPTWVVSLHNGESPADLVGALVEADVRIEGLETIDADLDDLYRHLEARP